jgi:hypothetical protein
MLVSCSQGRQKNRGAQVCAEYFSRLPQLLVAYDCIVKLELLQNAAQERGELGDDLLTDF